MGMPLQPAQRHAVRRIEVAARAQQPPGPEEDEARGVLRQLGGEPLDVLSHGSPLPSGRAFAPRPWRAALPPRARLRSRNATQAAPTGPTAAPPRRSVRLRPA